jgi:hypothetical protein
VWKIYIIFEFDVKVNFFVVVVVVLSPIHIILFIRYWREMEKKGKRNFPAFGLDAVAAV